MKTRPNRSRAPLAVVAAAVALALTAAACGDDTGPVAGTATTAGTTPPTTAPQTTTTTTTIPPETPLQTTAANAVPPSNYEEFRAQKTACDAARPDRAEPVQFENPQDLQLDPAALVTATIFTSCGPIQVELDLSTAPETVNSFAFLAIQQYFHGTAFHRIVPGFIIQGGDPTATGLGGPGYVVPDEFPPPDFVYERGVLAMANAGPNSTGSQFFIMLADSNTLPPRFTAFGRVTGGFEALDAIASLPLGVGASGEPSTPLATVYIERIEVG